MQKYVDLQSLGNKLHIISAFAVEHVKGFIYIEADKQCDINEVSFMSLSLSLTPHTHTHKHTHGCCHSFLLVKFIMLLIVL